MRNITSCDMRTDTTQSDWTQRTLECRFANCTDKIRKLEKWKMLNEERYTNIILLFNFHWNGWLSLLFCRWRWWRRQGHRHWTPDAINYTFVLTTQIVLLCMMCTLHTLRKERERKRNQTVNKVRKREIDMSTAVRKNEKEIINVSAK